MGLLIVTNDNFSTFMITATCVFLRTTTENDCQYICVYNKEWNVVSVCISKQVYFTVVKVNRVDIPISRAESSIMWGMRSKVVRFSLVGGGSGFSTPLDGVICSITVSLSRTQKIYVSACRVKFGRFWLLR